MERSQYSYCGTGPFRAGFPSRRGTCRYRSRRSVACKRANDGRISGAKSVPISRLKIGSFHMVEGKQLQVNSSTSRYQRELAYLLSIL